MCRNRRYTQGAQNTLLYFCRTAGGHQPLLADGDLSHLDQPEQMDGGWHGYAQRLELISHPQIQLQCKHTYEHMRPDTLFCPMVHQSKFKGAFEYSPTSFNFRKFFVISDNVSARQIHISGFEEQDPIDLLARNPRPLSGCRTGTSRSSPE